MDLTRAVCQNIFTCAPSQPLVFSGDKLPTGQLKVLIALIPEPIQMLQQQRLEHFHTLLATSEHTTETALWTDDVQQQFQQCWVGSEFVWEHCQKEPEVVFQLLNDGLLHRSYNAGEMATQLTAALASCDSETELMQRLRLFRQRQQLRIIFRDLNRLAPMTETTADVSAMADACIQQACDWLYDDLCQQLGTPYGGFIDQEPTQQRMIVLGMGKLGAHELNLSSDIDLIFCYPCKGETQGATRSLSNQEFFIRLGQRLIKVLDSNTADGFVFRVDMRLRPYGQSGALVLSNTAMEQYYQDQGRDWERYALIKARCITGDSAMCAELMAVLRPFVYRRYIDFGAISALRDMKQMIEREIARRNLHNNIKLGHGGIREIEFIAQSFQLIHGGKDQALQERSLLTVLNHLERANYLPVEACEELREAYIFLRNTEHALQAYRDQQTQTLPNSADEQQRLAWVMGFAEYEQLMGVLDCHRERVQQHFMAVVAEGNGKEESEQDNSDWQMFWSQQMEPEEELAWLADLGFDKVDAVRRKLVSLRDGKVLNSVRRQSAERINRFLPLLLMAVLKYPDADQVLLRLLSIVEAVLRRTAYLVLLMENPGAMAHLVSLCAASPWITEQIARHPVLLDEFLNLRNLYSPPARSELDDELRQQLAHIPEEDLDNQMEALRYFRMAHMLRVIAAQVTGRMPLMKESDYLTWTAEAILAAALNITRHQLVQRHGEPSYDGETAPGFIIVGYGKLGGIELGPDSDLDLVFIHNSQPNRMTTGERSIDNGMFFTRLGQRLVHMLSTNTISGQLYEVDMRLRPSGNSGLLVSSLNSFEKYQEKEAWTWEHQALVRARVVCGDTDLSLAFDRVRHKILTKKRDLAALRDDIRKMRTKMVANLGTKASRGGQTPESWTSAGVFHIKHDYGGIVDIEFIVQFAVLAWAHDHPELTCWSDNIRILELLADKQLLTMQQAHQLNTAYQAYRTEVHRRALQKLGNTIGGDQINSHRAAVITVWNALLEDNIPTMLA